MTEVKKLINKINRKKLTNNIQKVLLSLLVRDGKWMARTVLKIPNVGSRLRDLRKESFGGFTIECISAKDLEKQKRVWSSKLTKQQTFYRIDPTSVTLEKVKKVFGSII